MAIRRRDFLKSAGAIAASIGLPRLARGAEAASIYDLEHFGNARILHITDAHAQLNPVYFREPSVNIGIGEMAGRPPHLVGRAFLDRFGIRPDSADAYAFTCFEFEKSSARFGKLGGFAHLKTLIDRLRGDVGEKHSVLVDGGDLWQGTGLANVMQGRDMVEVANLLGIEAMTGHWEFTYGEQALRDNLERFKGEFLAQNVFLTEEAAFNDARAFDKATGRVFKPSMIKELGGHRVAIIGQAFPYVPIAHPKRFTPDWTFGIREEELQKHVDGLRGHDKVDAVILLSHNGMDVDLKLASRVTGIDVILGGHTHDAVPQPVAVKNASGTTLVTNAGSNGKFLAVLDLALDKGKVSDVRYHLLPVYSELLKPDPAMSELIGRVRAPHVMDWSEKIATPDRLLYRRGNFSGPVDQLICAALRTELDAEIALSPGFRWGVTTLPNQALTMEDVLAETAITYPETYVQEMTGAQIKDVLEDICDNLFNADPYYQQGGDMVRVGGLTYTCTPAGAAGGRISELQLDGGKPLAANKRYKVAGWASINAQQGAPVWDVVGKYLRSGRMPEPYHSGVTLQGVEDNPGIAGQG
ncbi:thiosulfohydrolase SoxB [Bradyrhizobium neotropicale]|uniref:Bifunctional metallophosphatase/5'-nucleotidase n=1 Tax=Bradyrhizobium neotropicale TaxID=1497615 RepID=A0A176Z3D7_9BRAD|nr:thiosulfohydrolase SoxB [Bradyrhizobium neotropicale]OAF15231.1 bifunctional metallophosphatase/5'-nucleotidase [Bradyrhizobium neotropicale]